MTQTDNTFLALIAVDKPNALALRKNTRDAHLAFVAEHKDLIETGGPLLSDDGDMIGSLIIFKNQPERVKAFIENDPYTKADLFEKTDLLPWKRVIT